MLADDLLAGARTPDDVADEVSSRFGDLEDAVQGRGNTQLERLFVRLFWALQLAGAEREPTSHSEVRYLRDCVDDPSKYSEEGANAYYRRD